MDSRNFVLVVVDLRARGIFLVVLGLVLATLGAFSVGITAAVINSLVGAVIFGALSGWRISGRTRYAFSLARPAIDLPIEPVRETSLRALYQVLVVSVLLLSVNLAFPGIGTDAGIGIGSGVAMIAAAADLQSLEHDENTRLLRATSTGYGIKLNWRSAPTDADKYRLTAPAQR